MLLVSYSSKLTTGISHYYYNLHEAHAHVVKDLQYKFGPLLYTKFPKFIGFKDFDHKCAIFSIDNSKVLLYIFPLITTLITTKHICGFMQTTQNLKNLKPNLVRAGFLYSNLYN